MQPGVASFSEPENNCHDVAREKRQHGIELTIGHGNREVGGARRVRPHAQGERLTGGAGFCRM